MVFETRSLTRNMRRLLTPEKPGETTLPITTRVRTAPISFCFVYDPEGRISNPDGLVADLERNPPAGLEVRVVIAR